VSGCLKMKGSENWIKRGFSWVWPSGAETGVPVLAQAVKLVPGQGRDVEASGSMPEKPCGSGMEKKSFGRMVLFAGMVVTMS